MKIVIDTNVVLDVLTCRKPFFERSQSVMQLVAQNKVIGAITGSNITDIYYPKSLITYTHINGAMKLLI